MFDTAVENMVNAILRGERDSEMVLCALPEGLTDEQVEYIEVEGLDHELFVDAVDQAAEYYGVERSEPMTTWDFLESLPRTN